MKSNNQQAIGIFLALSATAIWSGNFIIARGLSEMIPPVTLAFFRWAVAVIALFPFAFKKVIKEKHLIKRRLPYLIIISILGVSLFNTLIYIAGHSTTAINLSLISITFPIFVVIFSRLFLSEKITLHKQAGIVFVVIGVIILITKGNLQKLLNLTFAIGDLWMLLAAIIFAIYSIMLQKRPQEISTASFQLSSFIIGLLFLFPFFLWENLATPQIQIENSVIFSVLYVGLFASLAAYTLWSKAISYIGPGKASMIYYTLPLFSGISAYLFLGETFGFIQIGSMLLILAGIFTANFKTNRLRD
jgi:drug/metabolite transporter (DMT)-like permease